MAYTDYSKVQVLVQHAGKTFSVAQQTRCSSLLGDISDYDIDGYLGSRYVVPFAAPYPSLIVKACILLGAAAFLRGEMVDQPTNEAVERRADNYHAEGMTLLEGLLKNPALLSGSTAVIRVDEETVIAPRMRVSTSPASITFEDSSQWRHPIASPEFATRPTPKEYP